MSKQQRKRRAKAVAKSPRWLQAVQIAKPAPRRVRGSFGPASEVTRIDPATYKPGDATE